MLYEKDSASPRACFQFSEDLPKRTDFSPFLALAGSDKTGAHFPKKSSSASRASSMASATTSTCAPACRRR